MNPCPKPGKRRKPGIITLGEREICRTDAAWQKRRIECHAKANGMCQICERYTPIYAGHAHHPGGRGLGGGKRNDKKLQWTCPYCHDRDHVPLKVIPAKERSYEPYAGIVDR